MYIERKYAIFMIHRLKIEDKRDIIQTFETLIHVAHEYNCIEVIFIKTKIFNLKIFIPQCPPACWLSFIEFLMDLH